MLAQTLIQFYPYLLFIHVASALTLFAGEGAGYLALRALQHAKTTGGVRAALARSAEAAKLPHVASFLLLVSGVSMSALVWGFTRAWVDLALVVFFLIFVQVSLVDAPRYKRLARLSHEGSESELLAAAHDPALLRWTKLRLGATFSLVYLMTVKPGMLGSFLGVGLILGFAALVAFWPLLTAQRSSVVAKRAPA